MFCKNLKKRSKKKVAKKKQKQLCAAKATMSRYRVIHSRHQVINVATSCGECHDIILMLRHRVINVATSAKVGGIEKINVTTSAETSESNVATSTKRQSSCNII